MDKKVREPAPGEGLSSLRSTTVFRAVNFELYAKPNKYVMIIGTVAIIGCAGYIAYMRYNYDDTKYSVIEPDGTIMVKKKKSRWLE